MPTNDYHFSTHWRVPGTVGEVTGILADAPGLPRWWPAVYLKVQQLGAGDARRLGKVVDFYTNLGREVRSGLRRLLTAADQITTLSAL